MEVPPAGGDRERRCRVCGALVSADAGWCGQCFSPLRTTEPEPEAAPAPAPADQRAGSIGRAPAWPCPTCGHENPIELDDCAVCGTSFATLMRSRDRPPDVDPMRAFRRSLVFPGLGHRLTGHPLDGLARGVLFAILAVMALIVILSGVPTAVIVTVLVLFAGMALVVYVGSALEARRLAAGAPPFVSSRALLWTAVGVIMASVALIAVAVTTGARR